MKAKCKIKIGFFGILTLISVYITSGAYVPALIASVTLHELGHIVMAKLCGIELAELKLDFLGAALSPQNVTYSYGKEILLCLGGPLFNFVSALLFYSVLKCSNNLFIVSSIVLGTLNLLPVHSFDGGRVGEALLCIALGPQTATKIMRCVSFVFLFTLWCVSVYFLLRASVSLSLFVFSASMFSKIFISQNN